MFENMMLIKEDEAIRFKKTGFCKGAMLFTNNS